MSNLQTSPEFSAVHIDSVLEEFTTIVAKRPAVSSLIRFVTNPAEYATLHKYEWLEHKRTPLSWTVNGNSNAASTALVLDSTTGVKAGDVLGFVSPSGVSNNVRAKVTSVTNGTDLVIERLVTATLTDETILDNSEVFLVSRAKAENSTADAGTNEKPVRKYNFTQIFRRDITISRTLLQSKIYGLASLSPADRRERLISMVQFQAEAALQQIAYELNQTTLFGFREERADGGDNGAMGGIFDFLFENTSSKLDAADAALSQTLINNAVNQVAENGGDTTQLTVLLCHPVQARQISAFNTSGNNPVVIREDRTAGSYVAQYQTDLAATNGGALTQIVVDRNFPKDRIVILNPNNLRYVPMENFSVTETTRIDAEGRIADDQEGRRWKLLGELTLEFLNYADEAIVIHNIQVPA